MQRIVLHRVVNTCQSLFSMKHSAVKDYVASGSGIQTTKTIDRAHKARVSHECIVDTGIHPCITS